MGSSNSQVTQVLLKITINPNSAPCDVCRVHTLMLYTWLQLHMGGDIPSFIISPLRAAFLLNGLFFAAVSHLFLRLCF